MSLAVRTERVMEGGEMGFLVGGGGSLKVVVVVDWCCLYGGGWWRWLARIGAGGRLLEVHARATRRASTLVATAHFYFY